MADSVSTQVISAGPQQYIARFTNVSDGTGETAVVKVDISTLIASSGKAPTKTIVQEIQWSIQGFTAVRLHWDHTVPDVLAVLGAGSGYREYKSLGGLPDPASSGGTGDVTITTDNEVSGATYDIVIVLKLI